MEKLAQTALRKCEAASLPHAVGFVDVLLPKTPRSKAEAASVGDIAPLVLVGQLPERLSTHPVASMSGNSPKNASHGAVTCSLEKAYFRESR